MNFYLLVKLLWDEAGLIPTQAQLVSEQLLSRHQKRSSARREEKIQSLFDQLKNKDTTPNDFLAEMSKLHGPRETN